MKFLLIMNNLKNVIIIGIGVLILICFIIKYIKLQKTIKFQNSKIENLEVKNKILSVEDDTIRCFKHDFFNFVQALDGYVQTNDINGIEKMNDEILKECEELKNLEVLNSKLVNDPGVYSILTKKYFLAKKENIAMNIEILMDVSEIKISSYQLCKILSILLDNAIEAVKECDEKVVNVRFLKDHRNNKGIIVIENSYKKVNINLDKIFEKGYSTKLDKEDHGLGLWNVRRILNTTENLNLFTKMDKLFSQQLEIYN